MSPLAYVFSLPIRFYRLVLSPWLGNSCRFQPTCSVYAMEALARHGGLRGGILTLRRLARCNPWGGEGFDPVPEGKKSNCCDGHDAHSKDRPDG